MWNNIFYYFILIITIISQAQTAGIKDIIIPNQYTTVAKALVHILKFCGQQHNAVIIYDDEHGYVVGALSGLESLTSIILYYDLKNTGKATEHITKIDAIIINKKSPKILEVILDDLSQSLWWNGLIPHFILETENDSYSHDSTLDVLFNKDIPVAYVMSLNEFNRVIIITINPFVNDAPHSWNFSAQINNQSTSYLRLYDKQNICQEFYFDRTRHLNGHKINVVFSVGHANDPDNPSISGNITYDEKNMQEVIIGPVLYQLNMLISLLNIKVKFRFLPYGAIEDPHHDIYKQKQIDLTLQPIQIITNQIMENVFPSHFFQLGYLVQNRGYKTPYEKVWDYYGPCTLISMILILSITFMVLKLHNKNKSVAFSTFEILRLLINTGIYTKLNSRPLRIFFSVIFLYFLIIHATFSGHIVEFLTKYELRKNPNTLEDLRNPQYNTLYIPEGDIEWLTELGLIKEKSIKLTHFRALIECFKAVDLSDSNVCIHPHEILSVYSTYRRMVQKDKKVHQPLKGFGFFYSVYQVRKQWSIKFRVKEVFLWFWETGHSDVLKSAKKWIIQQLKKRKLEFIQKDSDHVPLSFDMLTFAFITLGIGLTCALVSFIAEIYKARSGYIQIPNYEN